LIPGEKNNFDPAGETRKMFYFYFCLSAMFISSKKREDVIILPHLFINIQPECHPHGVVGGNTDELLLDGYGRGEGVIGKSIRLVVVLFRSHFPSSLIGTPVININDLFSLFYPLDEKRR
jgi:hypothetical protein